MNQFGEFLKEIRGERSLREMERITGLSHTYLSTLEKGVDPRSNNERLPSLESLNKLSEALQIDIAVLLDKAGFPQLMSVQQENARLREALEFYADTSTYKTKWSTANLSGTASQLRGTSEIREDRGEKARQALEVSK